jgi:hypothetical protein
MLVAAGASSGAAQKRATPGFWHHANLKSAVAKMRHAKPQISAKSMRSFTLDRAGLTSTLRSAPRERTAAARKHPVRITLPAPNGTFQRFALAQSAIMSPGLAKLHPNIRTYTGRGIDDPAATIHADLSPLGFHASVRSPRGAWYIDPYYRQAQQGLYVSYYARSVRNTDGPFVERDAGSAELSVDSGFYHAADTVEVSGSGFADNAAITVTISDPEEHFASRTVHAQSNALGAFTASFVADPDGNLDTHALEASDGSASALASYQVVRDDDPTVDPPTGDFLRTYRLALITDPGYAAFFGGSANVTAAKVALMNRVDQIYEDDLAIRMQLIPDNDLLNLDTWDEATAPNGPCGAAACFTQAQVTGCSSTTRARIVIGQVIGASNYDIGHLALGEPGGGVANLGVVGRSNKAGGCTGIPTPVGDFYAVDYVAHEMGHQFSGNHPFNGNQLNCSAGNRNAATSVEPGSGQSVMAYAGICLTDDLQPHSDPYFSQRSQQEITTYVSSNQNAINEVQTASLRHFGGGNEVQVVTFGPGYAPASTVQPLSLAINAVPNATSRGGAQETGNTVTIATGNPNTLQVGDVVTIAGVTEAGYNGTFTVTAVPSSRSFQYTSPNTGLPVSGGGTVTLAVPGATESGTTVTINTAAPHGRSVGDNITIAGVGVAGYNGTFTITAVPTPRSFQYTAAVSGLAASGGGSATFFSPFQVRIGGNDSAVIGGSGLAYNNANLTSAINAIAGFAGTVTVTGAASTGFTVTYGGASAGVDVPSFELANLSCGGCFGSVEETNHGGANDSFTLNYDGTDSVPIVNGVNYSAAGILAALTPILPTGATATVAGFGGGAFNNTGFQVTFGGTLAQTNVSVTLALTNLTAGSTGFVGETDKGGPVDNKGNTITPTGNSIPVVTVPAGYTIPLRTPFALTGSATDADAGDTLTYLWEQNDRGGSAGTSLLNNTKTNGPLFAEFPKSAQVSATDTLLYHSPGENAVTTSPTRVFPDLDQIIANNTNAETGACPAGPIAPPVPTDITECYMEFLPTADYVGTAGVNASPATLHFRLTARDGHPGGGGVSSADTTLTLATNAGPFLVTSPNTAVSYQGGTTQSVTWDKANTDIAPTSTANVKISLSIDGGETYPYVLADTTSNDGAEDVVVPNVDTQHARIKVEAVDNVFFDISNVDFSIDSTAPGVDATASPDANANGWNNTDVTVSLSAFDNEDGTGVASITYSATGAQPIAPTTVSGNSASVVISAEGVTTLSYHATDNVGNSGADQTLTIRVDKSDPTLTFGAQSPAANANGWNNTDVSIPFTAADAVSGVDSTVPASSPLVITTEGSGVTGTVTVTDLAGNSKTFTSPAVNIDKTSPTVTASRSPAPNANGWNNTNVTATYDATDAGSGIDGPASRTFVFTSEGAGQSHSETFTDLAGNSATGTISNVNIDKTAPEAYLAFDPADKDIAAYGRDSLSGTTAGPLTPNGFATLAPDDHGFRAQRRTYDVVDRAGNTLRLTDIDLKGKTDVDATITSLQYNGGKVTIPFLNAITANWTLAKNGSFKTLDQTLAVLWPIQAATSTWRSSDNRTRIVSLDLRGLHSYTTTGMFLMRLATDKGSLSIEANPAG